MATGFDLIAEILLEALNAPEPKKRTPDGEEQRQAGAPQPKQRRRRKKEQRDA
jgi:hypothetical protein